MKRQRKQRSNRQYPLDHRKSKGIAKKKKSTSASLTKLKSLIVWITIEYYLVIKNSEIMSFTIWVDAEVLMLSEVGRQGKRNII